MHDFNVLMEEKETVSIMKVVSKTQPETYGGFSSSAKLIFTIMPTCGHGAAKRFPLTLVVKSHVVRILLIAQPLKTLQGFGSTMYRDRTSCFLF